MSTQPAEVERILRERARELARTQARADEGARRGDALVVRIGHARYAVPLAGLAGVVNLDAITPLPGAPNFVAGLAHLHGHVVTIVDLGVVLGEAAEPPAAALMIETSSGTFGLGVSAYEGVVPVPAMGPDAQPPGLSEAAARYVEGLIAAPGVGLLRLRAIVDDLMQDESGDEDP